MVLTQSVVKGAPLAISIRTSSSCPDRAASSSFFPKSTKDIYSIFMQESLNKLYQANVQTVCRVRM